MKDLMSYCSKDELWIIKENVFSKKLQSIRESQFTLGNGYLGTRGIYEEIPYDCRPGTYIAGLYDNMGAQVSELVNLPNPINFKFTVEGEKLAVGAMDILDHKRILNVKKGLLARGTIYKDCQRRRYDYQSLRFISMHDRNIGVMRIVLTPLDSDCVIDVNTGIDTSVSNAGVLTEGRKKHFRVKELGQTSGAGYLVTETFEKKHAMVFCGGFYYQLGKEKVVCKDNIFRIKLKKSQTITFTKVFFIKDYPVNESYNKVKKDAAKIFIKAFKTDFLTLLENHIAAWNKLWKKADIKIEGTGNLQRNFRFNIYHMLICANYDNGFSSIGARTLSGEGYRGHIFWDAEIFLLPFYLWTFPKVAKNMLLYRYNRLDASRQIAKDNGYKGAQFAWESGDSGMDETPDWARDFDGSIIKIFTNKMEHHITADVAYAVYKYHITTNDEKFMNDCGYEILIETARFWASRVLFNKRKNVYEIRHVVGPDEFHVDVNNNVFTNTMAKWNLFIAYKYCQKLKTKKAFWRKLSKKLKLQDSEIKKWNGIANKIIYKKDKNDVIEQFDGYFKLEKAVVNRVDENGMPILPKNLKSKDQEDTQLIKQADVLMLLYLLPDCFSEKEKKANYKFYAPRTLHKSSLSPSIQAAIASEAGDLNRAYNLFNVSLRTDISNLHGNTSEGIHAACLGGTWQVVVFGFAGIKDHENGLSINPDMPHSWERMIFCLEWKGSTISFNISNDLVRIKATSKKSKNIKMTVFGKKVNIKPNKVFVFERDSDKIKNTYHY